MLLTKSIIGQTGEKAAAQYLKNLGYKILALNYKNDSGRRLGELDIIAQQNDELVFVEVKTREYNKYGNTLPEENITPTKIHKMARIASSYLNQKGWQDHDYRFDAISVWLDLERKTAKIKHIKNL